MTECKSSDKARRPWCVCTKSSCGVHQHSSAANNQRTCSDSHCKSNERFPRAAPNVASASRCGASAVPTDWLRALGNLSEATIGRGADRFSRLLLSARVASLNYLLPYSSSPERKCTVQLYDPEPEVVFCARDEAPAACSLTIRPSCCVEIFIEQTSFNGI